MKLSFLVTVGVLCAATCHADWLNFRGPGGTGLSPTCDELPTELTSDTVAWEVDLPGRGLSSPVIVGDRIFITAASGHEQKQLHVICLATEDGARIWERKFWATGRTMCHQKTCVAAPSPASDGKSLFALYSSNDLVALDLEGNVLWMRGLTLDYPNASNSLGLSSSPIVADATLVIQIENDSESFAAGLDVATGLNRWKIDRPKGANWTSPVLLTLDSAPVAALQSRSGVLGVHPSTGSPVFEFQSGASTIPSSVPSGDILFVPSQGLTAVRPGTSGGDTAKIWNEGGQRPGTASPIAIGDRVYTINGAGVLSCANAENGERLWRLRLKGPFSASPVSSGSHLYVFNEKGVGQCVDLAGETGQIVSELDLGETILSTPSLSDNALYVRSDETLWKFSN